MFEITNIRIQLVTNHHRLLAFVDIVLDDSLIIRDLRVIRGEHDLFVNMPSRRITDRCYRCAKPNPLPARYCNWCGSEQAPNRGFRDDMGRIRIYADVCHPVKKETRDIIADKVLKAYHEKVKGELVQSSNPFQGYDIDVDDYEGKCVYE